MSTPSPPAQQPQFPSEHLSFTERVALKLMSALNRPTFYQRIGLRWGRMVPQQLVKRLFLGRLRAHQIEHLDQIPSDASILVVANHRTFFDLFVIVTALRHQSRNRVGIPSVFPVRAPFFYDNPLGVFMCLFFSGGCMYPPIFRGERRATLNPVGVEAMQWLIAQPKVTLGIHPEGHRSKQPDPFKLDPPKRGVGHLIQNATPQLYILPVFVTGIDKHISSAFKHVFRPKSAPIDLWWGAPHPAVDYQISTEDSADDSADDSAEKIATAVHHKIQLLADQARVTLNSERSTAGQASQDTPATPKSEE